MIHRFAFIEKRPTFINPALIAKYEGSNLSPGPKYLFPLFSSSSFSSFEAGIFAAVVYQLFSEYANETE